LLRQLYIGEKLCRLCAEIFVLQAFCCRADQQHRFFHQNTKRWNYKQSGI